LEPVEKAVHGDGEFEALAGGGQKIVHSERREGGAVASACVVDEVTAHGARGDGEEVVAVLPVAILRGDEPQINLVDEFSGLKGMAITFAAHQVARQTAEVRHHKGKEFVFGVAAASAPLVKQARNIRAFRTSIHRHDVSSIISEFWRTLSKTPLSRVSSPNRTFQKEL
jgi:hypothetical protein